MKSFIIKISSATLILALAGWLTFSYFIPQFYLPVFPFLLVFFCLITIASHAYQTKLAKKDIEKFTRTTMLLTFFRLVLYSVIAIVYIAVDKENALPFVLGLFILYLVFTFLEVSETAKLTRRLK